METISRTLEVNGQIEDIEIDVNVTHYLHVPPWRGNIYDCPSDIDATGFTTLEYEIVDTFKLTDLGERVSIPLNITQKLEAEIYDELLIRAANYREEDLGEEPLCYFNY